VTTLQACANHQEIASGQDSVVRQQKLFELLADPSTTLPTLAARFLEAPLYSRRSGFTTAYTAIYRPAEGRVDYLRPGKAWRHSFDQFDAGEYIHAMETSRRSSVCKHCGRNHRCRTYI
jgi:predicted choloylglycine hydrolase